MYCEQVWKMSDTSYWVIKDSVGYWTAPILGTADNHRNVVYVTSPVRKDAERYPSKKAAEQTIFKMDAEDRARIVKVVRKKISFAQSEQLLVVGTVVQLLSGGPEMTVTKLPEYGWYFQCSWFVDDLVHTAVFLPAVLKPAKRR
jgi:uncharacterized protein YodC (DUF2158 family)